MGDLRKSGGATKKQGGRAGVIALFSILVLASACGNLSQTAVNAMMGGIMADFHMEVGVGQWLTTSYMLMLGITVPAATWLSRRVSTRAYLLIALGIFLAGSLADAIAPGFAVLLIGRILQAMAAGLTMPLMQMIAMTRFPEGRRATAMGIAGVAMGFAPNIGPTVGGAMEFALGWRSFFLLLAGMCVVFGAATLATVQREDAPNPQAKLEGVSLTLSALGFGGVLLGFSNASSFPLANPVVWAPLALGALFLVLFVRRQRRLAEPLISMDIFDSPQYTAGLVALSLLFVSYLGVTLVVPLYVEGLLGGTALDAGMVLLPGTMSALVCNPLAGVLTDRVGARPVCVVAGVFLAVGAVAMAFLDEHSPLWAAMVFQGIRACGVSSLIGPLTSWSLERLPLRVMSDGSSFSIAVRQACASFGTSVMVLAVSAGGALVANGGVFEQFGPAFPYQLAFGFSAVAAVATLAFCVAKVRD